MSSKRPTEGVYLGTADDPAGARPLPKTYRVSSSLAKSDLTYCNKTGTSCWRIDLDWNEEIGWKRKARVGI